MPVSPYRQKRPKRGLRIDLASGVHGGAPSLGHEVEPYQLLAFVFPTTCSPACTTALSPLCESDVSCARVEDQHQSTRRKASADETQDKGHVTAQPMALSRALRWGQLPVCAVV